MEEFENMLKEKGFRLTNQRRIILEVFYENIYSHMDAKELWMKVQEKDSNIGIATVYRTIGLMNDLGIIINVGDKYEILTEEKKGIYSHLICKNCNEVIGVRERLNIKEKLDLLMENYKFNMEEIELNIYGICNDCKLIL